MTEIKKETSIFTKIINREVPAEIIWEDEDFISIVDIFPIKKGHILLIPKIEIDKIYDLPNDIYAKLFELAKKMMSVMEMELIAQMPELNVVRIGMAVEGFGVPHAHVHMMPLTNGKEMNPEKTYKASDEERKEMQEFYQRIFKDLK